MSIADRLAQKDLTLSTGPKEPPSAPSNGAEHAQLVKDLEDANYAQFQRFLAELKAEIGRDAAQLSGQLKEWEAGFERNQTAWSEEAKSLAQKSLNAALRAARENAARLLEESSRENAALIRKAFDDGFGRMRETLAVAQVIVWLALAAALVPLASRLATSCASTKRQKKKKRSAEEATAQRPI